MKFEIYMELDDYGDDKFIDIVHANTPEEALDKVEEKYGFTDEEKKRLWVAMSYYRPVYK